MPAVANPEVLARGWLAPLALGREREVAEVVRRLDPPSPEAPPPWLVAVAGSPGGGTSTVARRAAREVSDRIRAGLAGPPPRLLEARTAVLRGTHGVATSLLQRFDPGFDGRGFPAAEVLAGVLRRIRRDPRPTVVLLDDVDVGGPVLAPIVRALANPDRFLPEGESGLPPIWILVAGSREGLGTALAGLEPAIPVRPFVDLAPLSSARLVEIVRDRAERALRHAPPASLVAKVVDRTVEEGGSVRRALDLLRRELLKDLRGTDPSGLRFGGEEGVPVERRVVRAIQEASRDALASLGEVRRWEAMLAEGEGARPLPPTTLWRRIVRLERAGYVRREIRAGGAGGTRSIVRVLTPVDEWLTAPDPSGTPRADGWRVSGEAAEARAAGPERPPLPAPPSGA